MDTQKHQLARWDALKGYVKGRPRLEHTAMRPALARRAGGHGYVVTASAEDRSTVSGKSRQVVFGPLDVTLDEFLDALDVQYVAPQRERHPAARS